MPAYNHVICWLSDKIYKREFMKKELGITLIELMVVVSLCAILAMLVAPNLSALSNNSVLSDETNTLVKMLNLAKNTAINNNRVIVSCFANQDTCTTNNLSHFIVFADANDDNIYQDTESMIYDSTTLRGNLTYTPSESQSRFNLDGTVSAASTIRICAPDHTGYLITIPLSGRVNSTATNNGC